MKWFDCAKIWLIVGMQFDCAKKLADRWYAPKKKHGAPCFRTYNGQFL